MLPSELTLDFWGLPALQLPQLEQLATESAAKADLLIIAVDGNQTLSLLAVRWITRCALKLRGTSGLLVAHLNGILRMDQQLSPAYQILKIIADNVGVSFLADVAEPIGEKPDACTESKPRRTRMRSPVFEALAGVH